MDATTPEQTAYIIMAHRGGASADEISAATNIPAYRVRLILTEAGETLVPAKRSGKQFHLARIKALIADRRTAPEIADEIGVAYSTVTRWLKQEGLVAYSEDQRKKEDTLPLIMAAARSGQSLKNIARQFNLSEPAARKYIAKVDPNFAFRIGGQKIGKKPSRLAQVLDMHDQGIPTLDIAKEVKVHYSTVEIWLREDGRVPIQKPYIPVVKPDQSNEIADLYLTGKLIPEIKTTLGVSEEAIRKVIKARDILLDGGIYLRDREQAIQALRYFDMGMTLSDVCETVGRSYQVVRGWLVAEGRRINSPGRNPRT